MAQTPFLVALLVKEFQTWLRARLTFATFGMLVLGMSVLVFLLSVLILAPDANAAPALLGSPSTNSSNPSNALLITHRSLFVFAAAALSMLLAAGVLASAVASSAFAGERDRGTLDLLLMQGVGAGHIVAGKVGAAAVFSLLILLGGLPLFAPSWSYGGVSGDHLLAFGIVLLAGTLLFAAVGVILGAVVRGQLAAALLALGATLFLFFGTFAVHISAVLMGAGDAVKPLLWLNPFLALVSAGGSVTEAFARLAPQAFRGSIVLLPVALVPGVLLPAWVVASAVWCVLSIGLMAIASVVIDPCHPVKVRLLSKAP